jgi:hypothetical protein
MMAMSCSASGILPGLAAFFGQLDSDHQVVVVVSGEGMQIRFQHESNEPADQSTGGQTTTTDGADSHNDHVIQFAAAGDSIAQVPSLAGLDHKQQGIVAISTEQWILTARAFEPIGQARPPPGERTWNRCVRSVVLLV